MNVRDAHGRVRTLLIDLDTGCRKCSSSLANAKTISLVNCSSLCQLGKLLECHGPAVVLLCVDSDESLPPELLADIAQHTPSLVLLRLPDVDREFAIMALHLGVRGFICQDTSTAELIHAICCVGDGEIWAPRKLLCAAFSRHIVQPGTVLQSSYGTGKFTPREREIVDRLCDGLSNKEIARELHISDKTVKTHLQRIYRKSNVHSRLQLAVTS